MTQINVANHLPINSPNNPAEKFGYRLIIRLLAAFVVAYIGISSIVLTYYAISNGDWQFWVLAGIFYCTTLFCIPVMLGRFNDKRSLAYIGPVSGLLSICMFSSSILIEQITIPAAIITLLFGFILATSLSMQANNTLGPSVSIIAAVIIILAGYLIPVEKVSMSAVLLAMPVVIAIMVMIYITLLSVNFIASSIQIRLTTAFIALVIIPLAISSIVQNQFTLNTLRGEITDKTLVTGQQVAFEIDRFYTRNLELVKDEAQTPVLATYIKVEGTGVPIGAVRDEVQLLMRVLQKRETEERQFLSSYAILDQQGNILYDTLDTRIGTYEGSSACFTQAFQQSIPVYIPIEFSEDGHSYISFCAPIQDRSKVTVGVLRIKYGGLVLQRLLQNYTGLLGPYSYAILFDEYSLRLADTQTPVLTYTYPIKLTEMEASDLQNRNRMPLTEESKLYQENPELTRVLRSANDQDINFYIELTGKENSTTEDENYPEIGSVVSLSNLPWKVAYFQADFNPATFQEPQDQLTAITSALVALVVSFIGIAVSRVLSQPIISLTETAEQVAGGDLNARADITHNDETGALAKAFNSMTDRMNQFIAELEDRVSQRTNDLEQRNQVLASRTEQLRTVSKVAREIVTSQDLQILLNSVARLISERFGFYHVGIFLLDENNQYAVLRAANSEGGQKMLARQHKLQVGQTGIVGYTTGVGEPRIATDVGSDAVFFNNPDLPATRSEMALPLKINDRIIGALDVQSTESNAFSQDDIELFTTLADQVAVGIYNNQLYSDTARALVEAQNVHRQYLRQEWNRDLTNRRFRAFRYTPQGVMAREVDSEDIQSAISTGKPIFESQLMEDSTSRTVMAIPIQLRGETIGVIRVQDQGVDRQWSNDEMQAVQDVAQQVGVALENARLFEKTVQRAEREKKVLEITGLIRSTNDPQQMLEIAAGQIQKALGVTRAQIIIRNSNGSDHGSSDQ
jgi:GAF domain-containing protein/HAMP domain-containing protein